MEHWHSAQSGNNVSPCPYTAGALRGPASIFESGMERTQRKLVSRAESGISQQRDIVTPEQCIRINSPNWAICMLCSLYIELKTNWPGIPPCIQLACWESQCGICYMYGNYHPQLYQTTTRDSPNSIGSWPQWPLNDLSTIQTHSNQLKSTSLS